MQHIFLIGMPGSGKSTLGKRLALRLQLPFFDLDEEIVQSAGKSIPQLFEQQGEEVFRQMERQMLHRLCANLPPAVISTGGGAPCFFDNMDYIRRHGRSIFLNVNLQEIARRLLSRGKQDRPLLKDIAAQQLEEELQRKFERRKSFYMQADLMIDEKTEIESLVARLQGGL